MKYFEMYHAHKQSLELESKITMESVYERFEKKPEEEGDEEGMSEQPDGDQEGGNSEQKQEEEKVSEANERSASWVERNSIKQACEALKQGRRTLMYSYVFCYYARDNVAKEHFEDCQKYLQSKVERLSEFLEREVHTLVERENFQRLSSIVKFCREQSAKTVGIVRENEWEFLDL